MGANCGHGCHFDGTSRAYRRALMIVISINFAMFLVEMGAGAMSGSMALRADALDFFGDSLTYAISLYVIGKSVQLRASAALAKGGSLALMGAWVFASSIWRFFVAGVPDAPIMGGIGMMALIANLASVLILIRYKDGDANVRSVWLCSRNDAIGNVAVMAAAGMVALTQTRYPDLIVAVFMSGLFLTSAWQIVAKARAEWKTRSV